MWAHKNLWVSQYTYLSNLKIVASHMQAIWLVRYVKLFKKFQALWHLEIE